MNLCASIRGARRPVLGGQEEVLSVTCHARPDAQFRIAVPGSCVDVIDAVAQQHLNRPVCIVLAGAGECGGTE